MGEPVSLPPHVTLQETLVAPAWPHIQQPQLGGGRGGGSSLVGNRAKYQRGRIGNSDKVYGIYGMQRALINLRRACAARVIVVVPCVCVCVCLSVCLSVCYHYSGTTGYEAAKERYQRLERYVGIVFKKAIFLKLLRLRVMV